MCKSNLSKRSLAWEAHVTFPESELEATAPEEGLLGNPFWWHWAYPKPILQHGELQVQSNGRPAWIPKYSAARGAAVPNPKKNLRALFWIFSSGCFFLWAQICAEYVHMGVTQASKRQLKTDSGNPWAVLALAIRTPNARLALSYTLWMDSSVFRNSLRK